MISYHNSTNNDSWANAKRMKKIDDEYIKIIVLLS